ncbi:MAG: glutathione S-transferase family protein [Acidobacteria bacterium]|nr:MAG: glutathione S-transferase family protein [Acidobacteriota bacterium]REK03764.1 MAG: glutathione S-transferase family protein [Acidobacteriota bacterium]
MKLYEAPSPNAKRVHVFMAEKGIDCERVTVDLRAGENLSDEYRSKNPGARVPALELDDGTVIAESVAICRYFEVTHPEPVLFGSGALEQATVEMWQRRAEIGLMLNVAMAFRNISGYFKDRETCVEEWGRVAAGHAVAAVPMFDARLADSRYLAGERFSIADITLAVTLQFARRVQVELPEMENVARWEAEVRERKSYKAK